ncbi:N-acetylmuramoyl-L-alanine amidase [Lysobacter panacisoli]|uniref:N-acetylmuramoyl-L-alanine amidase n=1 Tax=Lysobacter panacisoli TaxID=1255263 RepID=UPI003CCDEA18
MSLWRTQGRPAGSFIRRAGSRGGRWALARYSLQGQYPGNPEIWHSLPGSTDGLRERDEDIRSRPLFANHVGASTLIHVHTNAGDPLARGTRVFIQEGRIADAQLGASILCYMREQIQSLPAYTAFPVQTAPQYDNYGENRLATMPSVIVEVGFHTNPTDAAALQNATFRSAAMRGVEKGYRLNSEGRTGCTPFAISSIPSSPGKYYQDFPVKYYFTGYPRFPVTLKTTNVSCPSGWTCSNKSTSYARVVPSPLTSNFYCTAQSTTPAATFKWRTTLVDADGVATKPVDHTTTCSPR